MQSTSQPPDSSAVLHAFGWLCNGSTGHVTSRNADVALRIRSRYFSSTLRPGWAAVWVCCLSFPRCRRACCRSNPATMNEAYEEDAGAGEGRKDAQAPRVSVSFMPADAGGSKRGRDAAAAGSAAPPDSQPPSSKRVRWVLPMAHRPPPACVQKTGGVQTTSEGAARLCISSQSLHVTQMRPQVSGYQSIAQYLPVARV